MTDNFDNSHAAHQAVKDLNTDHKVEYHKDGSATVHIKSSDEKSAKSSADTVEDALHDKNKNARSSIPDSSGFMRADKRNIKTKISTDGTSSKIHVKSTENPSISKSWFDKLSPAAQAKYKNDHPGVRTKMLT